MAKLLDKRICRLWVRVYTHDLQFSAFSGKALYGLHLLFLRLAWSRSTPDTFVPREWKISRRSN